jgi:hypothetical protein
MKHLCTFSLAALLFITYYSSRAENNGLPMPKEVSRAFERGTRSADGRPGLRYWQNSADYTIAVRIDPATRLLDGNETITYRNNSPDTLRTLVFRLYQNMNMPTAPRQTAIGTNAVTEGMRISALRVNGAQRYPGGEEGALRFDHTVMYLRLPSPLPPHTSVSIDIDWSFTIPVSTGDGGGNPRMGKYENGSLFLAYWFPRVAVYDDVRGWDLLPYDGVHEFYHDYGRMQVSITVPDRYGVWAGGMLQNADQVLNKPFLDRFRRALTSDSVVRIIDADDLRASPYRTSSKGNTWMFEADTVPDFAFGIAHGYRWDAVTANVDGRRVLINAAYDPASESFTTVAHEGRVTVEMMSRDRPGIPFPYPAMTVFNGYYGMEFPMIVNDGTFGSRVNDVYVHTHEIAHTYFPFMVGTNETRYAWMDEGMAYFLPIDVQKALSDYDHMIRAARGYERFSGSEMDYPMMMPSVASAGNDLQIIGYLKPALAFSVLRDMLGEQRFDDALKDFIRHWESRHPLPWDFFNTFNRSSGENLDWFWKSWFFEFGMPDLAIATVLIEGANTKITVSRKGSMPVPVLLTFKLDNGEERSLHRPASIWADGSNEAVFEVKTDRPVRSIVLGGGWIPDGKPTDNGWHAY